MATENVPVSAPGVTVTFDAEDGVAGCPWAPTAARSSTPTSCST